MNLFEEKKEITVKKASSKKEKLKIIESDYGRKSYDYIENFFENQVLFENLSKLFEENKLPNSLILESQTGQEKITFAFNLGIKCISHSLNETAEKIYEQFLKISRLNKNKSCYG